MKYKIFILFSLIFLSCSDQNEEIKAAKNDDSLPKATGAIGEVLLVMDTSHLRTDLGGTLEKVFLSPYPGLPQPELPYSITRIHFNAFRNVFKRHKTIVFLIPFHEGKGYMQQLLGDDVVEKISKSSKDVFIKDNVFANEQQIIFVFGNTQKDIINALEKNKKYIFREIDKRENLRLLQKLYAVGENKKLADLLKNDLGFSLRIPKDYKLVNGTEKFTWLRLALEEYDYNILVSKMPYSSEAQFDSSYVAEWRKSLGSNVNSGDTSSSKIVQNIFPIETKIISQPVYKVEDRGLWKLKNNTMGGPFLSYVLTSSDRMYIYYIEGFVAAPGKDKRELIREIETILSTFKG